MPWLKSYISLLEVMGLGYCLSRYGFHPSETFPELQIYVSAHTALDIERPRGEIRRGGFTNSGILSDLFCHTSCLADGIVHVVPKDTGGLRFFTELASPTGKHQLVGGTVLFRVEHVGTVGQSH